MLAFEGGFYEPTQSDRLWLMRAVQAEGPVERSVALALVNCFCLLRSRCYTQPLEVHIRAYSQPVNPRWYVGGDLYELQMRRAETEQEKRECGMRAQRREAMLSRLCVFTPRVLQAVRDALETGCTNDITDYAAPSIDASHKGYVSRSLPVPGVNRLWTRCEGWTGYRATAALIG